MSQNEQKRRLSQTQYRLIGYIPIIICFPLTFIIFQPSIIELIAASIAGLFTAIYDWSIEVYAYKKELWFCYGGCQKIEIGNKTIDFKHVPIDMIISFWFFGFMFSMLSTFPDRNRVMYKIITDPALTNPTLDPIWIIALCFILATFGAIFDYSHIGCGVWKPGKNWSFVKCAYIAWLSVIGFTTILFYGLLGILMM
ncbi:MAG: hypothetical protein ACFFCM_10635 [Promethearchaeota archaeon]